MNDKKFAAFLSFADTDRDIVLLLNKLFDYLGEKTYFAPRDIPERGSTEWRKAIIQGIKDSYCFVPIYTRHSLNRRWVLYESGVADALELERYPARVSGILHEELYDIPGSSVQVYDLFELKSLTQLAINVCLISSKINDKDSQEALTLASKVRKLVKKSPYTSQIISLTKARWVFVAGNIPRGDFWDSTVAAKYETIEAYKDKVSHFAEKLTVALLEAGFNLVSCPQIESIGSVVSQTAIKWLLKKSPSEVNKRFKYGGIYPIDRHGREHGYSPTAAAEVHRCLMEHRKSYLQDQEWLVIIGGSEGTTEEYQAADELRSVKIFAIPCFGGAGQRIWDNRDRSSQGPCSCLQKKDECNINEIVRYFQKKKVV